jgi:Rz lysis protein
MPLNPWVLLGVGVLWVASLVGVGAWQREDGATAERTAWQAKENQELAAANSTIARLNRENRALEAEHAEQIAAIGVAHEADRKALEKQRRDDVARARAGALRLRVPGGCVPAYRSPAPEASPPASERDAPPASELPAEVAANLLELVDDADTVAIQLGACQSVVRSYLNPKGASP